MPNERKDMPQNPQGAPHEQHDQGQKENRPDVQRQGQGQQDPQRRGMPEKQDEQRRGMPSQDESGGRIGKGGNPDEDLGQ